MAVNDDEWATKGEVSRAFLDTKIFFVFFLQFPAISEVYVGNNGQTFHRARRLGKGTFASVFVCLNGLCYVCIAVLPNCEESLSQFWIQTSGISCDECRNGSGLCTEGNRYDA